MDVPPGGYDNICHSGSTGIRWNFLIFHPFLSIVSCILALLGDGLERSHFEIRQDSLACMDQVTFLPVVAFPPCPSGGNTISFTSKFELYKLLSSPSHCMAVSSGSCLLNSEEKKKDPGFRDQAPEEISPHLLYLEMKQGFLRISWR